MVNEKLYEKLAKLAVRRGVNVQKDQLLVVKAAVDIAWFVRLIVKEAYEAGADEVSVEWRDNEISRLGYAYRSEESLSNVPDWVRDKEAHRQEKHACFLNIVSEPPGGLKGVDEAKINAYQRAYHEKMGDLLNYTMNNLGQWCVVGLPSVEWARVVFPGLSDEEAFEKLADVIFRVSRVEESNDPVAEWKAHDDALTRYCQRLNEHQFKELRFSNSLGTDLTVGLVENHIWVGGGCTTPQGVYFDPNIPTEECFCMPHRDKVNGKVVASRPLSYNGKVIEDFWFRFENGVVVEHGAGKEAQSLDALLAFDEGSCRLGEVALVPYESPVSLSGVLFFNTLYDENAACHLALGRCYPENLVGGVDMDRAQVLAHGGNDSMQHEDFMFGTRDMNVDGVEADGTIVPVFRNGGFVIDGEQENG